MFIVPRVCKMWMMGEKAKSMRFLCDRFAYMFIHLCEVANANVTVLASRPPRPIHPYTMYVYIDMEHSSTIAGCRDAIVRLRILEPRRECIKYFAPTRTCIKQWNMLEFIITINQCRHPLAAAALPSQANHSLALRTDDGGGEGDAGATSWCTKVRILIYEHTENKMLYRNNIILPLRMHTYTSTYGRGFGPRYAGQLRVACKRMNFS